MQLLEPYIMAHQLLCTPVSQHPDGIDFVCSSACLLVLTASTQQLKTTQSDMYDFSLTHQEDDYNTCLTVQAETGCLYVLQSLDTPLSALEVHPDGTVQYNLHCLQELSTHSPSAQTSGSGQESDSRVLVSPV